MQNSDSKQVIDSILWMEEQNRQALSLLLDKQREKDGQLLAISSYMGKTPSYITSTTLKWVAQHVNFAGDLPTFKGKVDKQTKKIPLDENTMGDVQQRQPDWSRQLPMALYLLLRQHHKFPPLLIVGYQEWIHNEYSDEWGLDKRAMENSLIAVPLEPKATYFDIDSNNTKFYALDGQHRLMAILGLHEFLTKGKLCSLDVNGKPRPKSFITRQTVIDQIQSETGEDETTIISRLEGLMLERIGIEIVPAVVNGETYKEALSRLRSTFVDVNEKAKKPSKGELILLDENIGFRIVARNIMVIHDLLKGKVDQKRQQLGKFSKDYTILPALEEVAQNYLGTKSEFSDWHVPLLGDKNFGFLRPNDSDLYKGLCSLKNYFDALSKLPSHIRFIEGKPADEIRKKDDEDNILFRPIAQMALAKAIADLERNNEMSLEHMIKILAKQEEAGQLRLRNRTAPWFGVLCEPGSEKMRRYKWHQYLCSRIFHYLLSGEIADDEERKNLLRDFADARDVGDNEAIGLDGKRVSQDKIQLPDPWQ